MFTATKPRAARGEAACSHVATSSLPVPCSPVTRTLASDGPTRSISCNTGRIAGDSAISAGSAPAAARSAEFSDSSRCARRSARPSSTALRTIAVRRALSHGFST